MAGSPKPPSRPRNFIMSEAGSEVPRVTDAGLNDAYSSSVQVTEALQRLPDNPCRFVMLSNWNASVDIVQTYDALSADALYENAGFEIYYGFRGVIAHQLFPSQSSPFLPISNTNLITVKVRENAAARYLWFSWFL